jgi:transposase InsO family protein
VAIADYIENFHNTRRRHSALDMLTPTEFDPLNTHRLHNA